jgi:hypothetical protein
MNTTINTTNTTRIINTTYTINITDTTNTSDTIQTTTSLDNCLTDTECDDNNSCTNDVCSDKKCLNNEINGCQFDEKCFAIGTILENQFCSTDKTIKSLKPNKEPCDDHYECLTELCTKNKCSNPSFISKISNLFKVLFRKDW